MSNIISAPRNFKIAVLSAMPVYSLAIIVSISAFLGIGLEYGNSFIEFGIMTLLFVVLPCVATSTLLSVIIYEKKSTSNLLLVMTVLLNLIISAFLVYLIFSGSQYDLNPLED